MWPAACIQSPAASTYNILSLEYRRDLRHPIRRGDMGSVHPLYQTLSFWTLTPISILTISQAEFTASLRGEPSNILSTLQSLKTHIYQSPDELLKAHQPPSMFVTWAGISGCSGEHGPWCIRIRGVSLFKFWCFAHAVCSLNSPLIP